MNGPRFRVEILGKQDRSGFECGVEVLDRYFRTQASQDARRAASVCYIAIEQETERVAGFYTLSAADIPITDIDPEQVRKFPRYPTVPAARIGRLAIDRQFLRIGLGNALLADAAARAANSGMGVYAVVVDAKDDTAAAFYRHHGFVAYGASEGKLLAPIKSLLV